MTSNTTIKRLIVQWPKRNSNNYAEDTSLNNSIHNKISLVNIKNQYTLKPVNNWGKKKKEIGGIMKRMKTNREGYLRNLVSRHFNEELVWNLYTISAERYQLIFFFHSFMFHYCFLLLSYLLSSWILECS